jgi:hypothetical protein
VVVVVVVENDHNLNVQSREQVTHSNRCPSLAAAEGREENANAVSGPVCGRIMRECNSNRPVCCENRQNFKLISLIACRLSSSSQQSTSSLLLADGCDDDDDDDEESTVAIHWPQLENATS